MKPLQVKSTLQEFQPDRKKAEAPGRAEPFSFEKLTRLPALRITRIQLFYIPEKGANLHPATIKDRQVSSLIQQETRR